MKWSGERLRPVIREPYDLKIFEIAEKLNVTVTDISNIFIAAGVEVMERSIETMLTEIKNEIGKAIESKENKIFKKNSTPGK